MESYKIGDARVWHNKFHAKGLVPADDTDTFILFLLAHGLICYDYVAFYVGTSNVIILLKLIIIRFYLSPLS